MGRRQSTPVVPRGGPGTPRGVRLGGGTGGQPGPRLEIRRWRIDHHLPLPAMPRLAHPSCHAEFLIAAQRGSSFQIPGRWRGEVDLLITGDAASDSDTFRNLATVPVTWASSSRP